MKGKKVAALIIGIPLLAITLFLLLLCMDGPAPDDSDLIVSYTPISEEVNGFAEFCLAGQLAYVDVDSIGSLHDEWKSDKATVVIESHARTLELWRRSMALPQLQVPEISKLDDNLGYLSKWRNLVRLVSIEARLNAENGHLGNALESAVDIIEFGRRQEVADGCLLNFLVSVSVKSIGSQRIRQIIRDYDVPTPVVLATNKRLTALLGTVDGLKNAIRMEYGISAYFLENFMDGDTDPATISLPQSAVTAARAPFLFKKNQTKTMFVKHYRVILKNCDLNFHKRDPDDFARLPTAKLFLSGNALGHSIFSMLVPSLGRSIEKFDYSVIDLSATRIAVAMEAYRNAHDGSWPKTLDALVPDYLDAIPVDRYSPNGDPLRYNVEKRIIYSVGSDGTDDGGMTDEDIETRRSDPQHWSRWRLKDPSFILEEPPPPMTKEDVPKPEATTE